MCQSGRAVGWEWRRGALIDSRVACLCLAGGEGGGGARSSLFKWRVGVWRVGRDGGEARFGWRCFLWVRSGGRARSTICWWRVGRVLGGGGKALIDMMVALLCVWRARRVENDGGKGARIDIRVACVLCLASGEGDKGGRGGGVRIRIRVAFLFLAGGDGGGWGGARSSIFGWRVVFGGWGGGGGGRAHRHSGGVLLSGRG